MKIKNWIIKLVPLCLVLFLDLFTKSMFQGMYQNGVDEINVIPNFFQFYYVENSGASFGILKGKQIFLIVFTMIMLILLVVYDLVKKPKSKWFLVGYSLVLAGGIGNLVDRIIFGFVRDFISFDFFPTVFNIADMSLVIGVICVIIFVIIEYMQEKENNGKISSTRE